MALVEFAFRIVWPGSLFGLFIRLCLGAIILVVCAPVIQAVALNIPEVQWTDHSGNHPESDEVKQCLAKGNIEQVWINSSGERLNCLVNTSKGIGDAVIQWSKRAGCWLGITAYQIGGGDLASAEGILKAKSCQQVWP